MRARARFIAGLSIALGTLVFPSVSRAQPTSGEHPLVRVTLGECADIPIDEVRKIVGVELGALLLPDDVDKTNVQNVTSVSAVCRDPQIELQVLDPITGKTLARTIDLSKEAPSARARLLALAIVELVSASWTELETNPQPKVKPVGATATPSAKEAVKKVVEDKLIPSPPPSLRVEGLGGRRWFFPRTGPSNMFGLRLGDDRIGYFTSLGWIADMVVEHAGVNDALGTVNVDLVSASAALVAHHDTPALSLRAGVGVRYGSARISGTPNDALHVESSSISGVWGGPIVVAGVGFTPLRPLVIEVLVEAGWTATAVRAHVGDPGNVGPSGGWLGASIAVGLEP